MFREPASGLLIVPLIARPEDVTLTLVAAPSCVDLGDALSRRDHVYAPGAASAAQLPEAHQLAGDFLVWERLP